MELTGSSNAFYNKENRKKELENLSVEEIYEILDKTLPHIDCLAFSIHAQKIEEMTGRKGLFNPCMSNNWIKCCEFFPLPKTQ